jgi:galactosamine-6-phosphate isomerase
MTTALNADLTTGADWEELSRQAAELIISELRQKPGLLLCAATGASPTSTYRYLANAFFEDARPFERIRLLALDEWGGLSADSPASCGAYLRQHLVQPLQIAPERFVCFRTDAEQPREECERVEAWLREHGPIDLCVLGIGLNGHIGLNEPAPAVQPGIHQAALSEMTLQHSMLRALSQPPAFGYTLGMADLLAAKRVLLLVHGEPKRAPMEQLMRKEISTSFPASFLWLHPRVTCFCEAAAAPASCRIPDPQTAQT